MIPTAAVAAEQPADSTAQAILDARAVFLRQEIELASGKPAYLVLDVSRGVLSVRRKHVELLAIPVTATVMVPGGGGDRRPVWPGSKFTLASALQEIERPRIDPPEKAEGDTTAAPVTVGDIQAARDRYLQAHPSRYRLTFDPGLEVEVLGFDPSHGEGGAGLGVRLGDAWRDLGHRLAGRERGLLLRVTMDEQLARRLYLTLEPGITLLIAPPDPR
ncbi:hypothetical protein KJ682_11800 [bacterium]|nr:hypothetical protein [bacterium]